MEKLNSRLVLDDQQRGLLDLSSDVFCDLGPKSSISKKDSPSELDSSEVSDLGIKGKGREEVSSRSSKSLRRKEGSSSRRGSLKSPGPRRKLGCSLVFGAQS